MKQISLTLFGLLLAGCSGHSEAFDCPAGKGVGCKSIDQVNDMVNDGQFDGNAAQLDPKTIIPTYPVSSDRIMRLPEQHLRVYLAGFEDAQGNFYEGGYVHTVVQPARWGTHNAQ